MIKILLSRSALAELLPYELSEAKWWVENFSLMIVKVDECFLKLRNYYTLNQLLQFSMQIFNSIETFVIKISIVN